MLLRRQNVSKIKKKQNIRTLRNMHVRCVWGPKIIYLQENNTSWLKLSVRRSHALNIVFERLESGTMYNFTKGVTTELQNQYRGWSSSELTRGVIHTICLVRVHNINAMTQCRANAVSNRLKKRTRKQLATVKGWVPLLTLSSGKRLQAQLQGKPHPQYYSNQRCLLLWTPAQARNTTSL